MTPQQNNGLASSHAGHRAGAVQPVPPATFSLSASARFASSRAAPTPAASVAGGFSRSAQNLAAAHVACRKPVAAHGWKWPSYAVASMALGVTASAVAMAVKRGTFDRLVLRRLGVKK